MNKIIFFLFFSLIMSIVGIWYLAHKQSNKLSLPDNTLIVGTNAEYAPFSFMQNGAIAGFDIDLINEIAKRMNKSIELRDMPFDALIPGVQTGMLQLIAGGITPTPERAQLVAFTKPYITGDQLVIISSAGSPISSLEQLDNKKVAVNEGYTADYFMSKIQGPELVRFASPIELFMALDSKRIDAAVAAHNTITSFIDHYGKEKFSIAPIPNTTDEYALAISKKHEQLLEPIQQALDAMDADGTLERLKHKWGLK